MSELRYKTLRGLTVAAVRAGRKSVIDGLVSNTSLDMVIADRIADEMLNEWSGRRVGSTPRCPVCDEDMFCKRMFLEDSDGSHVQAWFCSSQRGRLREMWDG